MTVGHAVAVELPVDAVAIVAGELEAGVALLRAADLVGAVGAVGGAVTAEGEGDAVGRGADKVGAFALGLWMRKRIG